MEIRLWDQLGISVPIVGKGFNSESAEIFVTSPIKSVDFCDLLLICIEVFGKLFIGDINVLH